MNEIPDRRHSLGRTVAFSLLPGLLILAFFVGLAPAADRLNLPSILVLFAAIPLVLIPCELGYLLYRGNKINGRLSLVGVVLYREKLPLWQYFVIVPLIVLWSGVAFGPLFAKLESLIIQRCFYWLPDWFFINGFLQHIGRYSQPVLLATWCIGLLFNGIAGPAVEELYFRGYLLPRLGWSRGWAAAINVLLFSLYHFFTPWQNLARIVALLPLVYVVRWKRNIYLGMIAHCLGNTISMIGMLPVILR